LDNVRNFLKLTFHWFKYLYIKKWTCKISARFHSLTKTAQTETAQNEMDQTESARLKSPVLGYKS